MRAELWIASRASRRSFVILAGLVLIAGLTSTAEAQYWTSYGRNAQHSGLVVGPSQVPQAIKWSTPVDLAPQYSNGDTGVLYTHYGSPVITSKNTVVVPQKTQADGSFVVHAFVGGSGRRIWTFTTDYILPSHDWIPPMGITLTPANAAVAIPGAGGSVWLRSSPDSASGTATRVSFVNLTTYLNNQAAFNEAIQISTPITSDSEHNLYFGYLSSGAALPGYPNGIPSGLARISKTGVGSYVAASSLCNDASIEKVVYNCAPALSGDESSVYVAVNSSNFSSGYLCQANSDSLSPMNHAVLADPHGGNALLPDDGTSSPTVGPDGDVYFGVLENGAPTAHHDRGWLLHFNATLTTMKIPGSFGWDDSASVVPSKLVPSYTGTSSYLLLTKYNDYANAGSGTGQNKVAVLDPNATEADPIIPSVQVMKEVITVLGPTPNPSGLPGVCEWCINSAAVDRINRCAIINSEDGHVYRWSFVTNALTATVRLAEPTGEAYTSTAIGPDGAVYAINNARLFCVVASGQSTASSSGDVTGGIGIGDRWLPITTPLLLLIAIGLLAAGSLIVARKAAARVASGFEAWRLGTRKPAWITIHRKS